MIIPSIDLQDGSAVQLIGGEEKEIDAGDPRPLASQFGIAGEVAVIDLDAAMSVGTNEETIKDLLSRARCRVGGGIRSTERAIFWLDAGAEKVILGTRAVPEILRELPQERVIAALDAKDGEIVVEGWKKGTGETILDKMAELRDFVGGFLVTFVEREGRLGGTNMHLVKELVEAAGPARVTIAGGVTTAEDLAELDRLGADAQVGMALYSGKLSLAEAIAAPLKSDRQDGLWPTVVCDSHGIALGLAYSNLESLSEAVERGLGVYHSRTRGLWVKGESSGASQRLLAIDLDCDRDTLRFTVEQQSPGFCHLNTQTCWGNDRGLTRLEQVLSKRLLQAPAGSYTKRLYEDGDLLHAKIEEEANELCRASGEAEVSAEAADVIYFTLVKMLKEGVSLQAVASELDKRMLKVTRRPGEAKKKP